VEQFSSVSIQNKTFKDRMSPTGILSFIIPKITLASGGNKEVEVDNDLKKI